MTLWQIFLLIAYIATTNSKLSFIKKTSFNLQDEPEDMSEDWQPATHISDNGTGNHKIMERINAIKQLFLKHDAIDARRQAPKAESSEGSSSQEVGFWKKQWQEEWMQEKFKALNATPPTHGDIVNMVAARPWGVTCGDPNLHDIPWGSCTLPQECDPEYRIYRGDYFCGRTTFVCCALQLTTYDMYQGFDASFGNSDVLTDSEEKKRRAKGASRPKRLDQKRRKEERKQRKRRIKIFIRKMVKEIKKILSRNYKNATVARIKRTKALKEFIFKLKKQYRKDRQSVKRIHELDILHIDAALQKKLAEILGVNRQYTFNATFRDIVMNGTVTKKIARMLVAEYPELKKDFEPYNISRRSIDYPAEDKTKGYLNYDIEYGLLYY